MYYTNLCYIIKYYIIVFNWLFWLLKESDLNDKDNKIIIWLSRNLIFKYIDTPKHPLININCNTPLI